MVLLRYLMALSLVIMALYGCNDANSLQRYLVDKQEDNNFVKIDLATSLLQSDQRDFSQEEKDILASVKKINVVAFLINDDNQGEYVGEKANLKQILAQERYKTLVKMGSNNKGATLKYLGEEDAIDELIVFASDDERGFAVFRLLGDNMRPDAMLKLMNSIDSGDIDASQLKTIGDLFSEKSDSI